MRYAILLLALSACSECQPISGTSVAWAQVACATHEGLSIVQQTPYSRTQSLVTAQCANRTQISKLRRHDE